MSYKKWNEAFLKHFFSENKANEIILTTYEEDINKVGEKCGLGDIENFIEVCFPNEETRREIFDGYYPRKRNTKINQKIKSKEHMDFGVYLGESEGKFSTGFKLPFLNFVILKILSKTINEQSPYFNRLKELKNPTDFDLLFKQMNCTYNKFKNQRIGKHRYEGLIKYQIVLTSKEIKQLEAIIYENHIVVNEEVTFVDVINKILPFIPESSLRRKVLSAEKDRAYATFFLNKVVNFDHNSYTGSKSEKRPFEKAKFCFAFKIDNGGSLHLLTNLSQTSPNDQDKNIPYINKDYNISLDNNRIIDGFSPHPVELNENVEFNKEYKLVGDDFSVSSMTLDAVNFFQKTDYGYFIQTKLPLPNTDTFIIVKNDKSEIKNFEKWIQKPQNATNVSDKIFNDTTKTLFGNNWIIYDCNGSNKSINKSYYKQGKDYINKLTFKKRDFGLDITIKGGYKVKDEEKTYLDIALPYFKVDFPNFNEDYFSLTIYDSNKKVVFREISYKIIDGVLKLYYNNDDYHMEIDHYELTFKYEKGRALYEKKYEFSVVASKLVSLDSTEYFKLDKWGKKSDVAIGKELVASGNARHELRIDNLNQNYNSESNYLIHLLSGVFHKRKCKTINRSTFNSVIDYVVKHFEDSQINFQRDKYSNTNLIHNLIALGYVNKEENTAIYSSEVFQLNPPKFVKIERAFKSGGRQLYKLTGARTKLFTQKLLWYCKENSHLVKFSPIDLSEENKLELKLLPDQIFIEGIDLDNFSDWIEQQDLSDLVFFNSEDNHHLGDSMLKFIASVSDFENQWVKGETLFTITDDNLYSEVTTSNFPRIRETAKAMGNPPIKIKVLEVAKDKVVKLKLKHWMEFYVRHKHKKVVMFMDRPKNIKGKPCLSDDDISTLYSKTYFYKYNPLPSLFYKALVSINHTLPKSEKVFIINSPLLEKEKTYAYNEFMVFNLSNKVERRRQVARIITGSESLLGNPQIGITEKFTNLKMYHHSGAVFNSDFDQFTTISNNNEEVIAITSLKNKVYVLADYLDCDYQLTISITNEDSIQTYKMVELNIEEHINHLISLIFTDKKELLMPLIKQGKANKALFYSVKEEITIKKYNE